MAKTKSVYVCQNCGVDSPKWIGKCPSCGEWNSYVEEIISKDSTPKIHLGGVELVKQKPILITEEESLGVDAVNGTLPREEGDRLAASYVNFYICNNAVIYPRFHDENDDKAEALLKECFPQRQIVGIYAREILLGGGNIHCITQQIPAATR